MVVKENHLFILPSCEETAALVSDAPDKMMPIMKDEAPKDSPMSRVK